MSAVPPTAAQEKRRLLCKLSDAADAARMRVSVQNISRLATKSVVHASGTGPNSRKAGMSGSAGKINYAQRVATRRKTLFPLDSKRVCQERAILARFLHKTEGFSFRAIRQILNLSGPEDARRLVVKGYRMMGLGPDGQRRLSA